MDLSENFWTALRALSANKLRSSLTMLGIIIGVGAVVSLQAIGNGVTSSITSEVKGIGSNLVTVSAERGGPGAGQQDAPGALYLSDYEALAETLTDVAGMAPVASTAATFTADAATLSGSVTATTEDYAAVNAYELDRGRFITAGDRDQRARVAVIGSETASQLFGNLNPISRRFKVNGQSFEVVGLLAERGSSGFGSADEIVIVPLETGLSRLAASEDGGGRETLSSIGISAADSTNIDTLVATIERVLRHEHGLQVGEDNDFAVQTQQQILGTLSSITTTLQIFLGAIASISLLVGGIGIMNIMLVSVTERTKEIGLRKAVGARQATILGQFLIETVVLSLIGGLLGILLGWGLGEVVTLTGLVTAVTTWESIAMSVGFATAIGLIFGLYPAHQASRLKPIQALRSE
jgi:putative ABC transport system permease protein